MQEEKQKEPCFCISSIMKRKLIFWIAYAAAVVYLASLSTETPKKQEIGIKSSTLDLIHRYEGFSKSAYLDSTGRWTIGVGHQIKDSEPQLLFANLSKKEVHKLLERDLKPCETFLKGSLGKPLTQNQFDALMSLCHNIGVDNLASSRVVFDIRRDQLHSAANSILNWNKPEELTKRRREERKLFLSDI